MLTRSKGKWLTIKQTSILKSHRRVTKTLNFRYKKVNQKFRDNRSRTYETGLSDSRSVWLRRSRSWHGTGNVYTTGERDLVRGAYGGNGGVWNESKWNLESILRGRDPLKRLEESDLYIVVYGVGDGAPMARDLSTGQVNSTGHSQFIWDLKTFESFYIIMCYRVTIKNYD